MKNLSWLLLFFLLLAQVADVDTEAEKTLKISAVNKVFSVLFDKELTLNQKKHELNEI